MSCFQHITSFQVSWSSVNWTSSSLCPLKKAIFFFLRMKIHLSFCFLFLRVAIPFFKNNNQFLCKLWVLRTVHNSLCLWQQIIYIDQLFWRAWMHFHHHQIPPHHLVQTRCICTLYQWRENREILEGLLRTAAGPCKSKQPQEFLASIKDKIRTVPHWWLLPPLKSSYWRDCPHW